MSFLDLPHRTAPRRIVQCASGTMPSFPLEGFDRKMSVPCCGRTTPREINTLAETRVFDARLKCDILMQEAYCKNTGGQMSGWIREDWQRGFPHKADALALGNWVFGLIRNEAECPDQAMEILLFALAIIYRVWLSKYMNADDFAARVKKAVVS